MATIRIKETFKVGGVLTDATTALLSDPDGTYGIKRNDTGEVVVADATALTKTATGTYEYTLIGEADVSDSAYVEFVYGGATYYFERDVVATESGSLGLTYDAFRVAIADYLGWGRNSEGTGTAWSTEEEYRLDSIIKSALNKVYYPQTGHSWSWMTPVSELSTTAPYTTGTVAIAAGVVTLSGGTFPSWAAEGELEAGGSTYSIATRDTGTQLTLNDTSATASAGSTYELGRFIYDLPNDFAGIEGDILTFAPDQAELHPPIEIVQDQKIRRLRQSWTERYYPKHVSIRPKTFDATTGQRFQAAFFPTPDKAYTLRYQYRVAPAMLNATNKYALGGSDIAELILQSCLSVAESRYRDHQGIHAAEFMAKLAASIEVDRRSFTPDTLGYNSDRSEFITRDVHDDAALHSFNGNYYYDRNP